MAWSRAAIAAAVLFLRGHARHAVRDSPIRSDAFDKPAASVADFDPCHLAVKYACIRRCGRLGTIGPMLHIRYEMTRNLDGWTVYDVFTGWPACVNGERAVGLSGDDAEKLVDRLNEDDFRRQRELGVA